MTIDQHIAAGIDLGSNTFRLLVASCTPENLKVLEKKLATVRLGHGLGETQALHESSMDKGLEVLENFRKSLDYYQPQSIRICGTEALRQARNSHIFLLKAEKILRGKIDIITGEEEAHLSLAGVLSGLKQQLPGSVLLVDVGGGSTEFVFADALSEQTRVASIGLGVVSLTEKYPGLSPSDLDALDVMITRKITGCLEKLKLSGHFPAVHIIGSGGSATSMAALDLGLASYSQSMVHGHILNIHALKKLLKRLIILPAEKRNELPCLGEGRGEILPAGIRIYQELLQLLQLEEIRVSDTGLLEGILLSSIKDTVPGKFCINRYTPGN